MSGPSHKPTTHRLTLVVAAAAHAMQTTPLALPSHTSVLRQCLLSLRQLSYISMRGFYLTAAAAAATPATAFTTPALAAGVLAVTAPTAPTTTTATKSITIQSRVHLFTSFPRNHSFYMGRVGRARSRAPSRVASSSSPGSGVVN
jgi:hypothetical protein